ncbi:hypothetical protein IV203_007186 [Nitzschia inconspicua]|uniref:Uncharacterized protein n=1 Tax=Nitzschia inconspicua TaxID=303405 RepID=A0A9K3KE80_9STRA|nr:hypothetical protein IV203_007186 [Nitzschia inconspicua]
MFEFFKSEVIGEEERGTCPSRLPNNTTTKCKGGRKLTWRPKWMSGGAVRAHTILSLLILCASNYVCVGAGGHYWDAVSQSLDEQVDRMSPGLVDGLNANSSSNITRFDGEDFVYGSYEWCNSDASDALCDADWDTLCSHSYDSGHRGEAQKRVMDLKGRRYLRARKVKDESIISLGDHSEKSLSGS